MTVPSRYVIFGSGVELLRRALPADHERGALENLARAEHGLMLSVAIAHFPFDGRCLMCRRCWPCGAFESAERYMVARLGCSDDPEADALLDAVGGLS